MRASRSVVAFLAVTGLGVATTRTADGQAFEVWAADQNGNVIYVLDRDGSVLRAIDVAAVAGGRRPHTIARSHDGRQLFAANTVSNQASVHRLPGGELVTRIEEVGKAPHAVHPHPRDPDRAYVCNIAVQGTDSAGNRDLGESVTELVRGAGGTWRVSRRLDLKVEAALGDSMMFPSRRPVMAGFTADGGKLLLTLFHGGIAVVDLAAWRVVRAWGADAIRRHATATTHSPDGRELYVTAGADQASWLYVFDVSGDPRLVASHDLAAWGRDAHGLAIRPGARELWVVHRASGTVTVHPLDSLRVRHTPAVVALGQEIPDLIEFSPDGGRAYVTLRGPNPAPTIPFPLAGKTPGVAILDAATRALVRVVPLGDGQQSDFHGIAVIPGS
jgi:DNA-binding beta-propeller fold protein YncE